MIVLTSVLVGTLPTGQGPVKPRTIVAQLPSPIESTSTTAEMQRIDASFDGYPQLIRAPKIMSAAAPFEHGTITIIKTNGGDRSKHEQPCAVRSPTALIIMSPHHRAATCCNVG